MQKNKNEPQMNAQEHGSKARSAQVEKLKLDLRSAMHRTLKNITEEKRTLDSEKICAEIRKQLFFQEAHSILFFASLPEEPDLWPLLNETLAGRQMVALPCFDADNQVYQPRRVRDIHVEILSGKFGIREPAPT